MNSFALPALKDKRARMAGRIMWLKKILARYQKALEALDTTIGLFEPSYHVGSIKPIYPRRRVQMFKHGALGRHIMDALRNAARPLKPQEIVAAVVQAMEQPKSMEDVLAGSVRSNLNYLARRGRIVKVGSGQEVRWTL
jgi:hypothetical protein